MRYFAHMLISMSLLLLWAPKGMSLELVPKIGLALGSLTKRGDTAEKDRKFAFGGVPVSVATYQALSMDWSGSAQFQLMMDFINRQIIRQGIDLGLNWHLSGGPSSYELIKDHVSIENAYDISWVFRLGYTNFSAVNRGTDVIKVAGSLVEVRTGFSFRRSLSPHAGWGLEVLTSVFNLPASIEQLDTKFTEASLFYTRPF